MERNLVEVFVEKDCNSCEDVLSVIQRFKRDRNLEISVFDRDRDRKMFEKRGVLICPATFINGRLLFYGTFNSEELKLYLETS